MSMQPSRTSAARADRRKRKKLLDHHRAVYPRDVLLKHFRSTNSLPVSNIADDDDNLSGDNISTETSVSDRNCSNFNEDGMNDDSLLLSISEADISASIHSTPARSVPAREGRRLVNEDEGSASSCRSDDDDDDNNYEDDDDDDNDDDNNDDNGDDDNDDDNIDDDDDDDIDDDDDDGDENDFDDEWERNPMRIADDAWWTEVISMKPNVTMLDIIAGITAIADRFHLTYAATMQIIKFMQSIVVSSGLPKTIKKLWTLLGMNREKVLTRHYYCSTCLAKLGTKPKQLGRCQCPRNEQSRSKKRTEPYFIQFKIEPQFQQLIQNPNFLRGLQYRRTRLKENIDNMNDTYDSKEYVRLSKPGNFLSNENNFSITLNTDGCSVSNSSNVSGWPILLQINELPPHIRKQSIILAGIWVDKVHPNLTSFMAPILMELQELYMRGVEWMNPINGCKVTSRLMTIVCSVDTPARADILNMTRFDGMYGCTMCKVPGETASRRKAHIYPICDGSNLVRTDSEMRRIMNQPRNLNMAEKFGIKGPSPLLCLPQFDMGLGVIVEPMHNAYLGVAKRHTMLLLDASVCTVRIGNMSVAKTKKKIDDRLLAIRRCSRISRNTRTVNEMRNWKANEWRNWLLYYAIICMEDVIVAEQLHLLSMLSEAIYIYNGDNITRQQLYEARDLINRYLKAFQDSFGKDNMVYNVHLLSHLPDTVENWGPFWCHSAFPFESWNKKVVDRVTSANSRPLQIATRQMMHLFLNDLLYNPAVPANTKSRVINILNDGKRKERRRRYHEDDDCDDPNVLTFLGERKSEVRKPEAWELEALQDSGIDNIKQLICYMKATVAGLRYERYDTSSKKKRHCDEYIYCDKFGFARILNIVEFLHGGITKCGFFLELLSCVHTVYAAEHINSVKISRQKKFLVIANGALKPAIYINCNDSNSGYAIALSNVFESD